MPGVARRLAPGSFRRCFVDRIAAMHPLSPLLGVAILACVLTANYFRSAWKLGILRAFGRRQPLSWRTWTASALAACLPLAGALLALALVPTGESGQIDTTAAALAARLALCGLGLHVLGDLLVAWGAPRARS